MDAPAGKGAHIPEGNLDVPLKSVVYSRSPTSSEIPNKTEVIAVLTKKAVGEKVPAFQMLPIILKIVLVSGLLRNVVVDKRGGCRGRGPVLWPSWTSLALLHWQ